VPPLIIKDPLKGKWVINWQAQYCSHHDLCMGKPKELWMKEAREMAEAKNRMARSKGQRARGGEQRARSQGRRMKRLKPLAKSSKP